MTKNKTCNLKNKNSIKDNFLVMSEAHLKNLSNDIFEEVEFITPLVEATINSILSQKQDVDNEIIIKLTQGDKKNNTQSSIFENNVKFNIKTIEIIDKGVGFDKEHRESFNKLANSNNKNCRGLGRLSFLQVFNKIKYHSVFIEDGEYKEIDFCFDENFDKIDEKDVKPSIEETTGTILTFEDITKEFIDDDNNVFSAEKILTRLLEDVLPHLLQYKCRIIVDDGNNYEKKENQFSLFIDDNNWKNIVIDTQRYPEIALNNFSIKYFLTDKLEQDYFYYLVNGRAVAKVYGNNKIDFKLKEKEINEETKKEETKKEETKKEEMKEKCIFVKIESDCLVASADWKRLKNKKQKDWQTIDEQIKSVIGNFIFNQLKNTKNEDVMEGIFNNAKSREPYLSKVIDDIQTKQPWLFVGGASNIIEIAEKELNKSTKNVMKNDKECTKKDIEIVKQDGLNKLVMTKYNVLKQAYEKFNDVKSDEVKDIHKLLDENLWLLDPKWEYADKISSEKSINTINKLLGLTDEEKNLPIQEIFKKHNINIDYKEETLTDEEIKKGFRLKPDIAIFNEESVIIIELKAPDVDLSLHTEKIKHYAKLISYLNPQYKRFYCFLVGKELKGNLSSYTTTYDGKGKFMMEPKMFIDLKEKDKYGDDIITSKELGSSMYYEICTYNKFLKDCYFLYHPFFKELKVKIDALEKYIPENKR